MSDLLIRNLEGPENCSDCEWCYHRGTAFGPHGFPFECSCSLTGKSIGNDRTMGGHVFHHVADEKDRDSGCPLLVVKDHGDLIERDSLFIYDCIKPKDSVGREQYDTLMGYEVYDMIDDVPVVIPSNRSVHEEDK